MDQGFDIIITNVATSIGDLLSNGIIIFLLCFILGKAIKQIKFLGKIPNDYIPFICMTVGAVIALLCPTIFVEDTVIIRIFKGIILGWAPTGMYEMIRTREKRRLKEAG